MILIPAAFCCLVQADKADVGTQGWGFPGQQLDKEGSEGRKGLREREKGVWVTMGSRC